MPSLWKKEKSVSRISQPVSDHQIPAESDDSTAVENGIPTSLVDRVVKNVDGSRKPSKNKRSKTALDSPPPRSRSRSRSPSPSPPSPAPIFPPHDSIQSGDSVSETIEERTCPISEDQEINPVPNSNRRVLVSVLSASLIVVLALCANNPVFGLSIAALLVLFMGLLWHCVVWIFKHRDNARKELKSFSFRVRFEGCEENGVLEGIVEKTNNRFRIVSCHYDRKKVMDYPIEDEIEGDCADNANASSEGIDEVPSARPRIDPKGSEKVLRFVEMEVQRFVMEEEERRDGYSRHGSEDDGGTRRVKRRNFWRKLMGRKLSRGKKKRISNDKECGSGSACGRKGKNNEEEWVEEEENKQEQSRERPPFEQEREEEMVRKMEEVDVVNGGEKIGRKLSERLKRRNGSYKHMFLMIVILAGLVRGRIVALVLTVIFCFVYKMAKSLVPPICVAR